MSVHAGELIHVGGRNVIDRIQSAGLGDVRLPMEVIREVGNREVVDKVPGEPDFTFTMEALDCTTSVEAMLAGKVGSGASASNPGASDPDGTTYDWLDMVGRCINILSPWKDPLTGSAGRVEAGHLIPGYYATRLRYRFGVTDNATQEVELAGGSYFYGEFAPVEDYFSGNGSTTAFNTTCPAVRYAKGGAGGTVYQSVFGVMVNGTLLSEDVDYTTSAGVAAPGAVNTITFATAPANGAEIRVCYFTSDARTYPQSVHANVNVVPAAVRGRNIHVYIEGQKVGSIQSAELEATVEGEPQRELGTEGTTGRTVNGTDTRGTITVRSRDRDAFFDLLQEVTGVPRNEVYGWFNENTVDLQIKIENPKSPGTILKTLWVDDAKFQPPGTPARVNAATDFAFNFESTDGSFKAVKGSPA